MKITKEEMKTMIAAQQGEMDALLMYKALARKVKDPKAAKVFRQLAAEEGRHASVFRAYTGKRIKGKKTKAIMLPIMYRFLGAEKVYPLIAKGEYDAAKKYESVAERFPEVESLKDDEKRHGDMVKALLK